MGMQYRRRLKQSNGVIDVYLGKSNLVAAAAESKPTFHHTIVGLGDTRVADFFGAMERISSFRDAHIRELPGVMEHLSFSGGIRIAGADGVGLDGFR